MRPDRILAALLSELVAPQRCFGCGACGPALCGRCRGLLRAPDGPRCRRCGSPCAVTVPCCRECRAARGWRRADFAVVLDPLVERLLAAWKDRGLAALAEPAAELVVERVPRPDADALVAVPAAPRRARRRGVDGPAALAARLGRAWELPVRGALLARTREAPQRGRSRAARQANARGAFAATAAAPRRVVLIDDVMTTGATVEACARQLRRAGAAEVDVVVFARALAPGR